jgi:ADP-ribose pyrophosphatase
MSNSKAQESRERNAKVSRKSVLKGRILEAVRDEIIYDDREKKVYDLVLHPGAVAIVPLNENGEVLLVKQWRRASEKVIIEIPAGTLEKGEDPLACASRELREETGMRAQTITPLTGFYTAPGILSEYIYLYLATDLKFDPLVGEDTDEIDLITVPIREALSMVESKVIIDAKTILGLLWVNQWVSV